MGGAGGGRGMLGPIPKASADWLTHRDWKFLHNYVGDFAEYEKIIDQLHADLETATANPEAAQKIIAKASEADLSLLRGLYTRSIGVTLSVAGVAFFGVLPRRTRPVVSAVVAVGAGSVAGGEVEGSGHSR